MDGSLLPASDFAARFSRQLEVASDQPGTATLLVTEAGGLRAILSQHLRPAQLASIACALLVTVRDMLDGTDGSPVQDDDQADLLYAQVNTAIAALPADPEG